MDVEGRVEESQERTVTAAADATTPAGPAPAAIRDGRLHFLALDLLEPAGRELDRVVTWVQADCRWHELLKLPPAEIEARVTERGQRDGETCYKVAIRNASSVPAVDVWLEVLRGPQGDEVLPSFWSDNALTLLPGERRELTVRFRPKQLGSKPPHLIVEGWNVAPRQWAVGDGNAVSLAMKVTGCEVGREAGTAVARFTAVQQGPAGPRYTTWPVPVRVDGQVVRWVRLGLRGETPGSAVVTLADLPAGAHRIAVGDSPEQVVAVPAGRGESADRPRASIAAATTQFADKFPGADAGDKIAAAIAALPPGGGIVDARGLPGRRKSRRTSSPG